jgi:hypothetical protein
MGKVLIVVLAVAVLLTTASAVQAKKGFSGVVEALPPGALVGDWVVSGVPVLVTPATKLKFKRWPPYLGAWVEVKGYHDGLGRLVARTIKEKKPKRKLSADCMTAESA